MTATRPAAPLNSPQFAGDPTAPTPAVGDADMSLATTGFVDDALKADHRVFVLGQGGPIPDPDVDAADFPFRVPYDCTLRSMATTVKTPPGLAMHVKLRWAAGPVTTPPAYSDLAGFVCIFTSGNVVALIDPTNIDVAEGDLLNFSCTNGDGANLLVEVVVEKR